MPWKSGSFFWTCFLFTNLEKMRSHGDDLVLVVGIGGLGILLSRLFLQIDLQTTTPASDQILSFYHNGMIDYLEFSLNPKTEALLDKFGEKFILTAGNIASYSDAPTIGCKIFSSFPEANSYTYRPSRKRIFVSHKVSEQKYLKSLACLTNLCFDHLKLNNKNSNIIETWIIHGQETPKLPNFFAWKDYKLLAEGHYTQIWSHYNWDMLLPFVGDSTSFSTTDIINSDLTDTGPDSPVSPVSIDSTHRDF